MNIKLKQKIVEALEDGVGDPDNPPRAPTGIVPSFLDQQQIKIFVRHDQ